MESFYIDLNEMTNKKSKLFRILIYGAIIVILLAVLSIFLLGEKSKTAEVPFIIMVVYFALYLYYAWYTSKAKLYIQADEYAVEYSFGMIKRTSELVIWDTIVKVKLGPTYVAFFKRSGKRKVISLGWLPYAKVVDIKEKLCKVCEFKGIACEKAEYQHFEKK